MGGILVAKHPLKNYGLKIMSVYKSYGLGVLASCLLACSCRSTRTDQQALTPQKAVWQHRPLVIDGSDGDWVKPLPYFDSKKKLAYSVSNDRDNIYIQLTTKDELEQRKIVQGGLTVWINGQAEKNETNAVGIGFPTDSRNNRDKSILAAARPDLYTNKRESLNDLKDYSLFGFNKDNAVQYYDYGSSNEAGVQVEINFNPAGELVYEALVPFKAIFPKNSSPTAGNRSIAVGFVIEGLPPQPGMRNGGGGGISVGGGLGMGTFGSGGGLGVSIGSGSLGRIGGKSERQLYKQTKIWQVLPLANRDISSGK